MDKPTFEDIVSQHSDWMRTVLYRMRVGVADLEDVLQQVLFGVARGFPSFEPRCAETPEGALSAWLRAICKRQAASFRREKRRRNELVRETTELDGMDSGSPTPEERFHACERDVCLRAALDELLPDRRAVIVAYELEGAAMADVAIACGISVNTAWNRLRLARQDMRAALERRERTRSAMLSRSGIRAHTAPMNDVSMRAPPSGKIAP